MLRPQERVQPYDKFEHVKFEDIKEGDWLSLGWEGKPDWDVVYQVCRKTESHFYLSYTYNDDGTGPVRESSGYSPSFDDKWLRRCTLREYKIDQEPQEDEETL